MDQSPSSKLTVTQSASQKITLFLCNLEIQYHVRKSPPLVPILSRMHPDHTFPPYIHKIQSNIIFVCTLIPFE